MLHFTIKILKGLKSLVDKNLLRRLEQNEDDGEDSRLAMLETVREYALEQLSLHGETYSMQRRHADYYFRLTERADQGPGLQLEAAWLACLNNDYSNVHTALTWLIEQSEGGAASETSSHQAMYLIDVLDDTWNRHLNMSDYRILFERLFAVTARDITPPRAWALIRGSPGEPCGTGYLPYFHPGANATRSQASKIVANTFFPGCDIPNGTKK